MARQATGFIGVDCGTSGCKAVLLGEDGRLLAQARREYPTRRRIGGEVTQRADDWLAAGAETVRTCVERAHGVSVECLSVTAPAHNVVLVGGAGEPLHRVVLWSDTRPAETAASLKAAYGDELFHKTFVELGPSWTFPQLVWLKGHLSREDWARIRLVLPGKDYVRYRMTGEAATDPSDAAGTAMLDQVQKRWIESLCHECALTPEQLPPIRPACALGGKLNDEWAHRMGIPAGTPVAVGATDTAAELVSVGAVEEGSSLVKIASSGTVVAVSEQPRPDRRVLTYPHAVEDRWYTLAATSTAATARRWLEEVLFAPGEHGARPSEVYELTDALANRVPAGTEGILFLPFLEGERSPYWDPHLRAGFFGLSSSHGRGHLCRAVLEGVAFSLRVCRDLLEELDMSVASPNLTGGGNASDLWRTILVSVLGRAGFVSEPQGSAVGAALIARAAVAGSGDLAFAGFEPARHAVQPREDWVVAYEGVYDVYRRAAVELARLGTYSARVGTDEGRVRQRG